MIRAVAADGRIETGGAFTPIGRPRVVERIAAAAMQRVVLLIAPAGYGKSVALRQYLEASREPHVRYDVYSEHGTLLGFVRGFADALLEIAPDARKTVSGAYEKSRASKTPGQDLAVWMHAHIKTYSGIVAIDDLHLVEGDPEITKFLVALIERTRGRTRWLIASRSTLDLPFGSWLAYGEMDMIVDEKDLEFTIDEARQTARASRVSVRDEELQEILQMTDGWPTALSFALRTSTRSVDLRNIAATTREMIYRYLAEQVYKSLTEEERDLLHFTAYLPEIDLDVMRHAGYDRAKAIVEVLRDRVAFIYPDRPGVYRTHDLFRDFVQHQVELEGDDTARALRLRVAQALEAAGRIAPALTLFAKARKHEDALRLIETHGFELMEQAHADAVGAAVDALPQQIRSNDAVVLALRAVGHANALRFERAEGLFQRALEQSKSIAVRSAVALRYGLILVNSGKPIAPLMLPLLEDDGLSVDSRAEIVALLAASYSWSAPEAAAQYIDEAETLMPQITEETTRAKVVQRLGFAAQYLHRIDESKTYSLRAAELATDLGLHSLAARAYTVLAGSATENLASTPEVLWYAQQCSTAAAKAGDLNIVNVALLYTISVETRRGNYERLETLLKQLPAAALSDRYRAASVASARAMVAASNRKFEDAVRLMKVVAADAVLTRDRIFSGSLCALWAAARDEWSESLAKELQDRIDEFAPSSEADRQYGDVSRAVFATALALAGKTTAALKTVGKVKESSGPVGSAFAQIANGIIGAVRSQSTECAFSDALEVAREFGVFGWARALELAFVAWSERQPQDRKKLLTKAELTVLALLNEGKTPKDIATETGRSVYTVQAHIQNIIGKLGCSGRNEALVIARAHGLLSA